MVLLWLSVLNSLFLEVGFSSRTGVVLTEQGDLGILRRNS